MPAYRVIFSPEAEGQLLALYRYIAREASPATAKRFTDATNSKQRNARKETSQVKYRKQDSGIRPSHSKEP